MHCKLGILLLCLCWLDFQETVKCWKLSFVWTHDRIFESLFGMWRSSRMFITKIMYINRGHASGTIMHCDWIVTKQEPATSTKTTDWLFWPRITWHYVLYISSSNQSKMLTNLANYWGKILTFSSNLTAVFIMIIRLRLWKRQGAGKMTGCWMKTTVCWEKQHLALQPVILA